MADALASGASSRKGVRVQVPPRPPFALSVPQIRDQHLLRYNQSHGHEYK